MEPKKFSELVLLNHDTLKGWVLSFAQDNEPELKDLLQKPFQGKLGSFIEGATFKVCGSKDDLQRTLIEIGFGSVLSAQIVKYVDFGAEAPATTEAATGGSGFVRGKSKEWLQSKTSIPTPAYQQQPDAKRPLIDRDRVQGFVGASYTVHNRLSHYGNASIFFGQQTGRQSGVVIKIMTDWQLFMRESTTLQALQARRSPHLPRLLDSLEGTSYSALVLRRERNDDIQTIQDAIDCMRGILKALTVCHAMNIIHRDIKRDNICFDAQVRRAVLIDFDSAKKLGGKLPKGLAGTLGYRAPEMNGHDTYDSSVDLWSFGVFAAELLISIATAKPLNLVSLLGKDLVVPAAVRHFLLKLLKVHSRGLEICFVERLLELSASRRITATSALSHPLLCSLEEKENYRL